MGDDIGVRHTHLVTLTGAMKAVLIQDLEGGSLVMTTLTVDSFGNDEFGACVYIRIRTP